MSPVRGFLWFRPPRVSRPRFSCSLADLRGEHMAKFVNLSSRLVTLAKGAPCRKPTGAARQGFGLIG
jgi:hypothetical protein